MGKLTIVMGIPGSGKSHYIEENFKDRKVFDLYKYQVDYPILGIEEVIESYEKIKEDVVKALKDGEDVVMEHTLLKAARRKPYLDAFREATDEPIEIVLINPPKKVIAERKKERKIFRGESSIDAELEILEVPTEKEGFDKITIIEE